MRAVVIISPREWDQQRILAFFSKFGDAYRLDKHRIAVSGEWGRFEIHFDHKVIAGDYSPEELAVIGERVPNHSMALLVFGATAAAELAICLLPAPDGTLIQNEDDLIAPIEEFRRRIREGVEWEDTESVDKTEKNS
jgi:hypothetical protein